MQNLDRVSRGSESGREGSRDKSSVARVLNAHVVSSNGGANLSSKSRDAEVEAGIGGWVLVFTGNGSSRRHEAGGLLEEEVGVVVGDVAEGRLGTSVWGQRGGGGDEAAICGLS